MRLFVLALVSLILSAGMLSLPQLTGGGLESIFARTWLLFGLLVFIAHYRRYLSPAEEAQKKVNVSVKVHRQAGFQEVRSREYM